MKIKNKKLILPIGIAIVLVIVGTVGALNGWFGGGGTIPSDTFTRGLVGYWSFNEGSGTTAYDASNYSNDGTLTNSPAWTTGNPPPNYGGGGGALQFDGDDDYVNVPNSSSLDVTGEITIEMWLKYYDEPGGWLVERMSGTGYGLLFRNSDSKISMYWRPTGNGLKTRDSTTALSPNQWYHIVYTAKNNDHMRLYLNGKIDADYSITWAMDSAGTKAVRIGYQDWSWSKYFNGLIDEVRIYDRALTAEEIRFHYNRGGPVAHWMFDEGNGTTTYDSTDNNNDGTLNLGTGGNTTTSDAWVTGKHGTALSFDGVDDYVSFNDSGLPSGNSARSVSGWIYPDVNDSTDYWFSYGTAGTNDAFAVGQFNGVHRVAFFNNDYDSSASVVVGQWIHVVAIYDGTILKIYLNGALDSTHTVTPTPTTVLSAGYIGRLVSGSLYWDGLVDDVRIYNYARTADEIRLDYNAGFAARFGPTSGCDDDPGACMTKGLVGYWSMDEGEGTTTYDASGNSNDGTLTNNPSWTTGKKAGALEFDGVDDYVDAGNDASLDITDAITIEVWVKLHDVTKWHQGLVVKSAYWQDGSYFLEIYSGQLEFNLGANSFYKATVAFTQDEWTHVVATFSDTDDKVIQYKNGEIWEEWDTAVQIVSDPTQKLFIGRFDGTYDYCFDGFIDEVRIYNRALSAEEIRYHYNRGGPVGYWKFDEGNGTTTYDSTDNNNDGTLNLGSSGNTTTSDAWVTGKHGTALSFDGTDDYVEAPDDDSLDITDAITISAWVYPSSFPANWYEIAVKSGGYYWTGITQSGSAYYPRFLIYTGSNQDFNGSTALSINTWYHIVGTWDKTEGVMRIYLNGVEDGRKSGVTNSITSNSAILRIGGDSGYIFNGIIDDVRIYNYARTPDEIRLDYNAGFVARFGPLSSCDEDPGACMTQGLVGYWGFNEGSGTTAYDASNYSNDGTLTNNPSWTTGKIGGALKFDGVDDYVNAGNDASLKPNNKTVEFWVKTPFKNGGLVGDRNGAGPGSRKGYGVIYSSTWDKVYWTIADNTGNWAEDNFTPIATDGWAYYVGVHDYDNGKFYMYENSVLKISGNVDGFTPNTGVSFFIGRVGYGTYSNNTIDEVRVYNRVLSAAEIRYHYNRGGPVGYWKFDEGEGQTAYDESWNDNDGQLGSTTASDAGDPTWVQGKFGSALSFDGVNNYVKTNQNVDFFDFMDEEDRTQSAWFKTSDASEQVIFTYQPVDSSFSSVLSGGFKTISGSLHLEWLNATPAYVSISTTFTSGVWHLATSVFKNSKYYLYLDGVLKATSDTTVNYNYSDDDTDIVYIGATRFGEVKNFKGLIDDIRIYNYARTPEQILQDYNVGLSVHFR